MGAYSGPNMSTSGLVLCLDAVNSKSYSGTGTNWKDLSGNNNNSTLVNNPVLSSNSFNFNGSTQAVNMPTTGSFKTPLPLTISCWVNGSGTVISSDDFNCNQTGGQSNRYYGVIIGASPTSAGVNIGNGGTCGQNGRRSASIEFPQISGWYNLVVVAETNLSSNQIFFYINGNPISASYSGNGTTLVYTNDKQGTIARRIEPVGFFNGNISTIATHNRALTLEEIRQNFNALRGRFGV